MNAPAFKIPEPRTPLEHAAAAIGWHPSSLRELVSFAGWAAERQATEFAQTDWLARLTEEVVEREAARCIKAIGPMAAKELPSKDVAAKIKAPALRAAAASYAGSAALLLGKTEVGKTLTALLMARKAAAEAERDRLRACRAENLYQICQSRDRTKLHVAWVSCAELARLVANQSFGREAPEVEQAKRAPIAVLDDLTWCQNDKPLIEIIAYRYDHGLPTISTAGATRNELVKRFGDAVMRRLIECRGAKGVIVESF